MFSRESNIKDYCFSSCAYSQMGFAAKCVTSSNGIKVLVLWCCAAVLEVDTVSVCFIQMYFANLSHAVVLFLERIRFLLARLLATLANKPYVFSLFLIALSLTLTCNIPNEGCRVWDVALGSFAIFLAKLAQSKLWVNLLGHSVLGKLQHCVKIYSKLPKLPLKRWLNLLMIKF